MISSVEDLRSDLCSVTGEVDAMAAPLGLSIVSLLYFWEKKRAASRLDAANVA
jgi:hypothetical protein